MEIIIKIDTRNKSAKSFVKYLLSLPFVAVKEIRKKTLSKSDEILLELMKKSEKTGYLTKKEIENLFNDI